MWTSQTINLLIKCQLYKQGKFKHILIYSQTTNKVYLQACIYDD